MQTYEIGYLVLPSIPENDLSGIVDTMKNLVEKAGSTMLDSEAPFKQDLAYTMSKTIGASRYVVTDAYLGWFKFEGEPEKIGGINDGLGKISELLRFLLIKAPKETTFTFAKARAALEEEEENEEPASVHPRYAEGSSEARDSGVTKEAVVE